MGKNTDFNRAAGSIYWTAMHAAQALAVTLTDAPPPFRRCPPGR